MIIAIGVVVGVVLLGRLARALVAGGGALPPLQPALARVPRERQSRSAS